MDGSDDEQPPGLLPMLTLTVGNTELKPGMTPDYNSLDSGASSPDDGSDPNRFNAYLNRGSELWTHWTWLGGQGKMSLMRCNYCLVNKQLKNAPKCRRHLIKCPKTPEPVRRYFEKKEIEATRVSALMRELRSKEIKFPRQQDNNNKPPSDHKLPVPTANDLKHLQLKQHSASLNNVIVGKQSNGTGAPGAEMSFNGSPKFNINSKLPEHSLDIKPAINFGTPQLLNGKSAKHDAAMPNGNHVSRGSNDNNLFSELSIFYQQFLSNLQPMANTPESIDLSKSHKSGHLNGNGVLGSNKLKRKLSPAHDAPSGGGANCNGNNLGNTNKENKEQHHSAVNGVNNTTVVINLDDVNPLDESMFFSQLENNGYNMAAANGGRSKKKRDSVITNGFSNGNRHESKNNNGNGFHTDFSNFNSTDLEIVHDDLNDLLASALISNGIDFEFITNPYFQKFIAQLVSLSGTNKNYRLPSVDKLSTANLTNLVRKFDYETSKIFSECDSIVVCFDWNKESDRRICHAATTTAVYPTKDDHDLDVNLLISSSNVYSQLFFKSIPSLGKGPLSADMKEDSLKALNNQINSLVEKIGSGRINAVILPYDEGKSSEVIHSYLSACHSHIVPLTNVYQMFHHLLCDICKIPSIHKLLTQCIGLFKELAFNFADFQEENESHWKRVLESDNLKIYKHFLKQGSSSSAKNHWVSLNLALCWFIVAKASISELFCKLAEDESNSAATNLSALLAKLNIEATQVDRFFSQISVLFNFLTPFITAIHLIENESCVISDIAKIYFDVKLAINNSNFFDGVGLLCDKLERQSIDCILHNYLQEQNLSRYFFLAFYLDPRYRTDKRIEENEELIAQVYDSLFSFANSLGCVNSEEEDRERLADSLDEFRNGDKLYGAQLLKCPKSPIKFWKHLRRFPASSKLAYCASRLLSISTRSMLLTAPLNDKCTSSLHRRILTLKDMEAEPKAAEKILPIKSYLMSHCETIPNFEEDDRQDAEGKSDSAACADSPPSAESISNIIYHVITSLDHYSQIIAQPYTSTDLSRLTQTST